MTMKVKHWQDPVNLVLGLWMVASPYVLGYSAEDKPLWNAVVFGFLVAVVAWLALYRVSAWQQWANAAFGAWLLVSPWALGFTSVFPAALNAVLVGVATLAMAAWALGSDRDIGGWWNTTSRA